jgi:Ca-activated chloride channel homolog
MKRIACFFTLLFATFAGARAQIIPPDILLPIPPPRLELTDTNSSPMQVKEMSVAASVRGLYATLDTTLVFQNPNPRLLEGDLVFPLPDGAAVCGYALDINGVLTDGVVVKKEKARVAFEAETRRRVDPGIVEHVKGNLYRTRIYPLPANGTRTIRLSYTTPLSTAPNGDAALLLPMPRATIEKLSVKIEVANEAAEAPVLGGLGDLRFQQAENFWRVESTTTNSAPTSDVWVALPKLPASLSAVEKSADGSVWFSISAMAPPPVTDRLLAIPSKYHILWDASGSRANLDLQKEYELVSALQANSFDLIVFRDAPEASRDFKTAADLVAALKEVSCDGGSDFATLAAALPNDGAPVLLFTDGIDTLSDKPLEFNGTKPIAIISQTIADREALRQACAGALIDLQTADQSAALAQIYNPAPRVVGLKGTGIANIQGLGRPATGRVTLLGQLTVPEATVQIEYAGGTLSAPFTLRAEGAREGKTLATAWAAARVNQLSPRADQFEDDLLALGRKYGLVSPATSLIVLESVDQWVRHEIEPPASLPEMREQYDAAMKNRGQETTDARTRHLEQLTELWKQRVEWWKTDFAKNPLPTPSDKEGGRGGISPFAMAERAEAMPVPVAPPAETMMAGEVDFAAAPAMQATMATPGLAEATETKSMADARPASSIQIKEWNPDTPYLKAIRNAKEGKRYDAYLSERKSWSQSPAFFLDCADEFLKQPDKVLGLRILSNLAELKIEDSALLRVFAWRLRQAGDPDRAIVLLRRVAKLRAEEPQSFRDLALALAERGKAAKGKADLDESMALFLRVALTPWNRQGDSIPLFALEELNALVAWINRQEWKDGDKPTIPDYDEKLRDNLDTDIRIVMSWDADATDIDLHVVEPGGEEAYYGHNRTARGGLVSRDITDGYGPEEYLVHAAPPGPYAVKAKYYGSHQQTLVGPATLTATVFTDWGRATEKLQTLTLRLDKPHDMVDIGSITFGTADASGNVRGPQDFSALRAGMTPAEVVAAVGEPGARGDNGVWSYVIGMRNLSVHFDAEGQLVRVVETLPGGIENIVVQ